MWPRDASTADVVLPLPPGQLRAGVGGGILAGGQGRQGLSRQGDS